MEKGIVYLILQHKRFVKEKEEGDRKHFTGFREALRSTIKSSKVVSNAAIGRLYKMGLRFGDNVSLRYRAKGYVVATVGIGVDDGDEGR